MEILTQLTSLGLGAVIAGIVLIWKRADDATNATALKEFIARMEVRDDRALKAMEAVTIAIQSLQKTVESLAMLSRLEDRIAGLEGSVEKKKW